MCGLSLNFYGSTRNIDMAVLLRNVYAAYDPESQRVLGGVNIYVDAGVVEYVGENVPPYAKSDHVLDCRGKIVLPGFSNVHTHLGMNILRGFADDLPLKDWLSKRIWPEEVKLDREHVRAAARLAAVELLHCGVTAVCDMYFYEDIVASATVSAGIRTLATPPVFSDGFKGSTLSEALHVVESMKEGPMLRRGLGPHSTYACDRETLAKVYDVAERFSLKVHIHVAETRWSQVESERRYGRREVELLEELGLVTPKLIAAHAVWITKGEIGLLAKGGASVVFCPVSNAKLGEGGVAPIPELLEAGVNVCFGTDGAASNNSLDIHETVKFGVLLVKNHRWDPTVLDAKTAIRMATTNGYKAMGFPLPGVKVGDAADLITIPLTPSVRSHPEAPIPSRVVYSAIRVEDVIVNGEPAMLGFQTTKVDEDEVLEEFEDAAFRLASDRQDTPKLTL